MKALHQVENLLTSNSGSTQQREREREREREDLGRFDADEFGQDGRVGDEAVHGARVVVGQNVADQDRQQPKRLLLVFGGQQQQPGHIVQPLPTQENPMKLGKTP